MGASLFGLTPLISSQGVASVPLVNQKISFSRVVVVVPHDLQNAKPWYPGSSH